MTYKLNQSLLQKLRNGEIAIDNEGNNNTKLLRQIIKAAFPNDKMVPAEGYRYYYVSPSDSSAWNHTNMPIVNSTVPLNDFIQKGVVVGYKLKTAYCLPHVKKAVWMLCPYSEADGIPKTTEPSLDEYIPSEHPWIEKLRQAGVLDLWFDVITEEPKEEKPFPPKSRLVDDDLYDKLYHHYKINELLIAGKIPFDKIEGLVKQYDK